MALADIRYHTDIWPRNLTQAVHLAKITDTHFQNGNLMFLTQTKHSKRQPQLIIKVPQSLKHPVFFR